MRPKASNHQEEKGEEELFLELRVLEQIGNWSRHAIVPPACSILVLALADTATPFTTNFRPETSPVPSSLIGWSGRRTSPAPNNVSGVTSTPSASRTRWRTFTTCAGCLNGLVKPRLGMRRMRDRKSVV